MKRIFLLLLIFLVSCTGGPTYKTGTYEDEAEGRNGPVRLSVTIDAEGKIQRIDVLSDNETKDIMDNVSATLSKEIIRNQNADVDTLSGATQTSEAYINAVKNALDQAR